MKISKVITAAICLASATSFAASAEASEASDSSVAGLPPLSFEVFAIGPPVAVNNDAAGFYVPRGLGLNLINANSNTVTQFGFGLNGGVAYRVSDLLSVGGAVGIDIGSTSADGGSGTTLKILLEPLVKLNLGKQFGLGKLNPFGMVGIGIGAQSASIGGNGFGGGATDFAFVFDLDAGIEYHITPNWAVMGFIPIDIGLGFGNPTVIELSTGIEYGVSFYF